MNLKSILLGEILPNITKPSQYLGVEVNSVHKNADETELRVALAFPDLYELGLGNLGLQILYGILNRITWCWAERAYAPAPDLEAALRERGLPLFAMESKDSLADMDLIGFSLQSELTYTSVLNMLDLAGVPLRSKERTGEHPLIFAGGPTAFNPEPMAPFMDFFVIGDGEDAIVEIAEAARQTRGLCREERLAAFAEIEGVYVPERYPFETLPDGRVVPCEDAPKIARRVVSDLNAAAFPADSIVPFTQLVHDRIGIEVLRGCTHGCRFCHAGMVGRPVRTRDLETIDRLMAQSLEQTGYEEVSLVSLSTCDYPRARALLDQSARRAHAADVAVSLPSLRLDTFSVKLADAISGVRRSGLTFAPEAATPRLRAVINKSIEEQTVIEVTAEAFKRGWEHVKYYFMIGLPTETDEDVEAIVDMCLWALKAGHVIKRQAKIFTGISTFVPKPFTPFQWAEQISYDETQRRQRILELGFRRHSGIKFGRHDAESTFIEGLIARADRRAADLIEAAFRRGARLDSSSEHLAWQAWQDAIEETGCDVAAAFRARDVDERLPWDHIDPLIPKSWFQAEWRKALDGACTPDCRTAPCNQCGLRNHLPEQCSAMATDTRQGMAEEREKAKPAKVEKLKSDEETSPKHPECSESISSIKSIYPRIEPAPIQRLRFRVGRRDEARFLSHLEWMSAWVRVLRRAQAPLSYSQGFHAHPKITFATAPPVGEESEGEYMDIVLRERVAPDVTLEHIRATLPRGFGAYETAEVPLNAPSLMSAVRGFDYAIHSEGIAAEIETRIDELMAAETIFVERKGRPSGPRKTPQKAPLNIRPQLHALTLRETDGQHIVIDFSTRLVQEKLAKPREIIELLQLNPSVTRVVKRATLLQTP